MSRHGYVDYVDDELAAGRWRGAILSAIRGKRGQAFLQKLIAALDALPEKELYPNRFATAEGGYCALGAVARMEGLDIGDLDPAEDEDPDDIDREWISGVFGIAPALAAEVMYLNDDGLVDDIFQRVEICGPVRIPFQSHFTIVRTQDPEHAKKRWKAMREWAVNRLDQKGNA